MDEIKRCPFCSGVAQLNDAWPHYVYCTRCNARTVNCCEYGEYGERRAVRLWNRRDGIAGERIEDMAAADDPNASMAIRR